VGKDVTFLSFCSVQWKTWASNLKEVEEKEEEEGGD
jgi:hypothetical protein